MRTTPYTPADLIALPWTYVTIDAGRLAEPLTVRNDRVYCDRSASVAALSTAAARLFGPAPTRYPYVGWKRHRADGRVVCPFCPATFSCGFEAGDHIAGIHGNPGLFATDQREWRLRRYFSPPARDGVELDGDGRFRCPCCPATFKAAGTALDGHLSYRHDRKLAEFLPEPEPSPRPVRVTCRITPDRRAQCPHCPKTFRREGHMLRHLRVAHEVVADALAYAD